MFVNPEIPLEVLPRAEGVCWQALHPRFIRCLLVKRLLAAVAALLVLVLVYEIATYEFNPQIWLTVAAVLLACASIAASVAWPLVDVPRRGYAVRDKDILYKSGVLWQSVKAVPFNRVQHAVRGSGPVERRFGLASLTAYTAGGSGGDLRIAGLGEDVAERLRTYIVGKLGEPADASPLPAELGEAPLRHQETDAAQRG